MRPLYGRLTVVLAALLTLTASTPVQRTAIDVTTVATRTTPRHTPTPRDSADLARTANHYGVPVLVMLGAFVAESGRQGGNTALGPGVKRIVLKGAEPTVVCREIGRAQINPCAGWEKVFPPCRQLHVYEHNVACGAAVLAYLHAQCGSWSCAVERYNGRGPAARRHRERVERIIGQLVLN